jgi:TonB family protein
VNVVSQSAQVFVKTPLGSDALVSDRAALPPPARQLLILVDGKRSIGELETLFGQEPVRRFLPLLQQKAYVQSQDDIFGPSTAVPARTTITAAPQPTPAPGPAPQRAEQPAARSAAPLVLSLIGGSVAAALGFGLWYFKQVHPVPEVPSPPPVADAAPELQSPPPVPAIAAPKAGNVASTAPATASAAPPASAPAVALTPSDAASLAAAARALGAARSNPAPVPATPPGGPSAGRAQDTAPPQPRAGAEVPAPVAPSPAARTAPPPAVVEVPQAAPVATVNAAGTTDDAVTRSAPGSAAGAGKGAGTSAPATPVALHGRNRPLPSLPKRARRADVTTGRAVVRLHVTAAGTVDKVELVSAKPAQVYDDQVAATLMQWTFDPPGQETQTTVELDFKP